MPSAAAKELEGRLSYGFRDIDILVQALTHKSYTNENRELGAAHNERLEFLGDTVLDFVISDFLVRLCPDSQEGELSKLRAVAVSEPVLADAARKLGFGSYLRLGRGEEQTGGRDKDSLLANALEAVIAAMYLDGGLSPAQGFITSLFGDKVRALISSGASHDAKTDLQEYCQSAFGTLPSYVVVGESGPDHQKTFEVEIKAGGRTLGRGGGRSKKEAEQSAAREALARLNQAG